MTPTALLQMRGIRKSFPGVLTLDGVNLDVHAGEVHVVLGENGAGKSTLMKILSGAYDKDASDIRIAGASVEIRNPCEAQRLGIATIYQEPTLIPGLSTGETIFLRDGKYVTTHRIGEVALSELVRLMANRELSEHFPKQVVSAGKELLRVSNLTRGRGLRNVGLTLREGEILGVAATQSITSRGLCRPPGE